MDRNTPEASNIVLQLHIVETPENESADDVQVDIEAERKHIIEQAEAEAFWAGRNLAARNSTRKAA